MYFVNRQAGRQTCIDIYRQINRQADRQIYRHTDIQTHRYTDTQVGRQFLQLLFNMNFQVSSTNNETYRQAGRHTDR